MGTSSLSRSRVFTRIPRQCFEAYRTLHISTLRRFAIVARALGADAQATTDALKDRKLRTLAVMRRLYQGEEGRGNDALEVISLRARITRAHAGTNAIVQMWHEAVDVSKGGKEWLKGHSALSKQLPKQAFFEKRAKRARDLAEVAHYRRSLRVLLYSSPTDLERDTVIAALCALHPTCELLKALLPTFLPSAKKNLAEVSRARLSSHGQPLLCVTGRYTCSKTQAFRKTPHR